MRVFVLIPVFNRLAHTKKVLGALKAQSIAPQLRLVVVDDGSTDGTAEYLASEPDVVTLTGDGNLWWGGAIQKGLAYMRTQLPTDDDFVLFVNNDTWFDVDYVQTLIETSRLHGGVAVGSVIHEEHRDDPLVSIGPRININRIAVWDLLAELPAQERLVPKPIYWVDALSGRGTLYPVAFFKAYGGMRPWLLPHYLADYEIAMRFARDSGTPLLVSSKAIVFSPPVYGNEVAQLGRWERYFGQRSSSNVIRRLVFYCMVGSPLQRLTAPLRLAYFGISRYFHHKLKSVTSTK